MHVVTAAGPLIILLARLESSTFVTVTDVKVQQCCRGKYFVNVKRTKTTKRLVTKENFLMTPENAFLMLGHCPDVEVASTTPLQQQWSAPAQNMDIITT